jgi:hypothetical protein
VADARLAESRYIRYGLRALADAVVGRDRTLRFLADAVERAGLDLSPGAAWLLLRANAPDTV